MSTNAAREYLSTRSSFRYVLNYYLCVVWYLIMSIRDETIGGYTASKALQCRVGMVVMYRHRMYSIGINMVWILYVLWGLIRDKGLILPKVELDCSWRGIKVMSMGQWSSGWRLKWLRTRRERSWVFTLDLRGCSTSLAMVKESSPLLVVSKPCVMAPRGRVADKRSSLGFEWLGQPRESSAGFRHKSKVVAFKTEFPQLRNRCRSKRGRSELGLDRN